MKKGYYLYAGRQKVKVSEDIYKVYCREREHEKYLEQMEKKNHLFFFYPWIRMDILQKISLMRQQTFLKLDFDKHISVKIELNELGFKK